MPGLGCTPFKANTPTCQCSGCVESMEGHCSLYSRFGLKLSATKEPLYPLGFQMPPWHFKVVLPIFVPEQNTSEMNNFCQGITDLDIELSSSLRSPTCFQSPNTWEVLTPVLLQQWPSKVGCWLAIKPFIRRHLCDETKGAEIFVLAYEWRNWVFMSHRKPLTTWSVSEATPL